MNSKRKRLAAVAAGIALGLFCILIFLVRRTPPSDSDESVQEVFPHSPGPSEDRVSLPVTPSPKPSAEGPTSIGVFIWPGMTGRAVNYSRQILSWMKDWGFECGFVTVERGGGVGEAPPKLPSDVAGNARTLSETSSKLNAILVADGDLSGSQAVALKEYLISGGWLIMPSPEDGGASAEAEELLQLKPSRSATLIAPESPHSPFSFDPLGAEEVRALVSHPVTSGLDVGSWLEWTGPAGKALYSKGDSALPLLCFRRPELPAVRLIPFGEGGVVHLNFPLRPGPLIEEIELKSFLGQTLTWLWGRASWAKPGEKEGIVPGIVRKKDGTRIPAAKVSARVFSEDGEPTQTLDATSSKDGRFSLSLFDNAIYWVKADAEGYYQADMYLLARPKGAEDDLIEVLMEPEGAIFGHAYYGPGEDHPAVGISVTLAPNCRISSAREKETVTDGKARFSFDHLPSAQTFYLIAKAEGWMGIQEAPLPLDGESLEIDVHLEIPFAVGGITMNAVTQQPLPGVEIIARPRPIEDSRFLFADALRQQTVSAQEGNFMFSLLPGGWSLAGQAEGLTPLSDFGVHVSPDGQTRPSPLVLEFCPHVRFHGTVFQSSGEPAPHAKVVLEPDTVCQADAHGRYETDPAPPSLIHPGQEDMFFQFDAQWEEERGAYLLLVCRVLKREEPRTERPWVKSYSELVEGDFPVDIHLQGREPERDGNTISGIVLDLSGEPSSSTKVELAQPRVLGAESQLLIGTTRNTSSRSDGTFEFSGVPDGLWLVRARKNALSPQRNKWQFWGEAWVTVDKNTSPTPLEITLGKAHILGRVLEKDGTPTRNRLAEFELTLHTGYRDRTSLLLEEDGAFSVFPSVRAALTRPPTVAYKRWARDEYSRLLKRERDELGSLPWEGVELPPEGFVSVATIVGHWSPESRRVDLGDVKWGEESLTVIFGPYGSLRGRLVDADTRTPVPYAGIGAMVNGHSAASCVTDSEGCFSLTRLPPGKCTLTVQHGQEGYWLRRAEIEITQGGQAYVEIDVWKYFIIRGRLLLKDTGEPLVAQVHTEHGIHTSDSHGRLVIPALTTRGVIRFGYTFSIPLQRTGLKSVKKTVIFNLSERELDVGNISVEREEKQGAEGAPDQ